MQAPAAPWFNAGLARLLEELSRDEEAEALLRTLGEINAEQARGYRNLGILARQGGDHRSAYDYFQQALACAPQDMWLLTDLGHAARELGRLDEAESLFQRLTGDQPDFAQGFRGLGMIARQRGDHRRAHEWFQAAAARVPDDPWIVCDLGHEALELKFLDEAEAHFRRLIERHPDFAHGFRGLGIIARLQGDHPQAYDLFGAALALEPDDPWIVTDRGHEARETGRIEEAESLFRQLAARRPDFAHGLRGLGMIQRQKGQHCDACETFRAALAQAPTDRWILLDYGLEALEMDFLKEAESAFLLLLETYPDFAGAPRGLAVLARQKGDYETALAQFKTAALLEPENYWHKLEAISALRVLGRAPEAQALAQRTVAENPNSATALVVFAHAHEGVFARDKMLELHREALRVEPENLHAQMAVANELIWQWRLDEAQEALKNLLARKPDHAPAALGLAQAAQRRGDAPTALHWLAEAHRIEPSDETAAIELAMALNDANRVEEAEQTLRDVIGLRPGSYRCAAFLGHLARTRGDFKTARQRFAELADRAPAFVPAQIELAEEDFRRGQIEAALVRVESLLHAKSGQVDAYHRLAHFFLQLDDLSEALAFRRKALETDRSNLTVHLDLARLEASSGQLQAAEATLRTMENLFGAIPEIALVRADVSHQYGRHAMAFGLLREACARWPGNFELWLRLALELNETGAFDAACALLDQPPLELSRRQMARVDMLRGQIDAARWRTGDAIAAFLRASAADPANPALLECLARAALLQADTEAASRYLTLSKQYDGAHLARNRGVVKPSQTHFGQLLDEYRLDHEVLVQMTSALAAPEPLPPLEKLVLAQPDHSPAAIGYLIALRQAGKFAFAAGQGGIRRIPAKITQFWDDDIPLDVLGFCESWREKNPQFSYRRYSRTEARDYLGAISPVVRLAFDRAREPAMKADIFRLAALFREGGYYADADDACLAPIETIMPPQVELALYQEEYGTVGNNFIACVPGHPVMKSALEDAVHAINRGDADIVWLATGPGLLTRHLARFLAANGAPALENTLVLERFQLFRAVAMHCPAAYKHSSRHWIRSSFRGHGQRRRAG